MKKTVAKVLICTLIIYSLITPAFLMLNVTAIEQEFDPPYGTAPEIDGIINKTNDEWDNALKNTIRLYNNESQTDSGIPISFWVMQNETNLYISIQFDLETHKDEEFIGVLISERISVDHVSFSQENFVDGKIIQFSNISNNEFDYMDYTVDNNTFTLDAIENGTGAATLELKTVTYEFSFPVNSTDDSSDVFLDYGESYGFKILYGESDAHPDSIKKFNTIIIKINYPGGTDPPTPLELIRFIVTLIVFSLIGTIFGFYVYKITLIKKKVERVRG